MATEGRKHKLAEWIRGWKLEPRDENDRTADAHNAAINMVIDQLYDPEESADVDELLGEAPRISGTPSPGSEARPGVGGAVESNAADEKGLASRVEELEKMLSRCYVWLPLEASALADDVKELLGLETYRALAQPSGNGPGKDGL